MSTAEAIHAAEFLLVLIAICLLSLLEVFNLLLQKLGQTVNAWKGIRRACRREQADEAEDEARDAEPGGPNHLPPR